MENWLYRVSWSTKFYHKLPKSFSARNSNRYWCWSRRQISEDTIKKAILSTAIVDDYKTIELIKQPFSVRYLSNGTHYKCDGSKRLTDKWYSITDYNVSPCVTNTSIAVNVKFKPEDNKL